MVVYAKTAKGVDCNSAWDPKFLELMIEWGTAGLSYVQIAAAMGVSKKTLANWLSRKSPHFKPGLRQNYDICRAAAEAKMVSLGQEAAAGGVKDHNASTYKLICQTQFPEGFPGMFPNKVTPDNPDDPDGDVEAIEESTSAKDAGQIYGEKLKALSEKSEWD